MKNNQKILGYLLIFVAGAGVLFVIGRVTNVLAYPGPKEENVPKTFSKMVKEALVEVPTIKPEDGTPNDADEP